MEVRSMICTTRGIRVAPSIGRRVANRSALLFTAEKAELLREIVMLFVTFHGGKPGKHPLRNNIHAYDKDGKLLSRAVLEDTDNLVLDELRGIYRHGTYLY